MGAPPAGAGGPLRPSERTHFSKFQNRFETFRYDKFDQNEQENNLFSRIDALCKCREAIMSKIREKSLVGKKFDTLSQKCCRFQNFCSIFMKFYTLTPNWLLFIKFKPRNDPMNISEAIRHRIGVHFFLGQTVFLRERSEALISVN